eukprot:scaffold5620_cov162-Skeletonema_marinoi.AAC.6
MSAESESQHRGADVHIASLLCKRRSFMHAFIFHLSSFHLHRKRERAKRSPDDASYSVRAASCVVFFRCLSSVISSC